jgi:hypothetical protein
VRIRTQSHGTPGGEHCAYEVAAAGSGAIGVVNAHRLVFGQRILVAFTAPPNEYKEVYRQTS